MQRSEIVYVDLGFEGELNITFTVMRSGCPVDVELKELVKELASTYHCYGGLAYDVIRFFPYLKPGECKFREMTYNDWKGFRHEYQARDEKWLRAFDDESRIAMDCDEKTRNYALHHIKHVLADGRQDVYKYIVEWIAHLTLKRRRVF